MTGITRREFLNGMAVAAAGSLTPPGADSSESFTPYPPALTGLRGSHPGSFEIAHALRDGAAFHPNSVPVDETFDLVVVGGGISGLSAAAFYLKRRPHARVLILETNDDFGGHAKRNEFVVDDKELVGYGGTQSIESPHHRYVGPTGTLLSELGIDVEGLRQGYDLTQYVRYGMTRGVFFKKETFGTDAFVRQAFGRWDDWTDNGGTAEELRAFVSGFPLSAPAKQKLIQMYTSDRDVLAGQSIDERRATLRTTSAADFLRHYWAVDDEILNFLKSRKYGLWALGLDSVPAFRSLDLPGFAAQRAIFDKHEPEEPYTYHFPDGNATIARLLVHFLVPSVTKIDKEQDVTLARFDYAQLDRADHPHRIRLNSTVVNVRNVGESVEVAYVERGHLRRAQSTHSVLACYHCMIPYLAPELPQDQRAALARNVKVPLVYVTLAARNWHAWQRLGVASIDNPGGTFSAMLDFPVSVPGYPFSADPSKPICIHLEYEPTVAAGTLDDRGQYRAARRKLYAMTFDDLETVIRDEMTRMLGPSGFDFDRDIAAITINRWPHGYSYTTNTLFDTEANAAAVMARAKRKWGQVAIANADAAYDAISTLQLAKPIER
jgi:spermidine dehydrogenase